MEPLYVFVSVEKPDVWTLSKSNFSWTFRPIKITPTRLETSDIHHPMTPSHKRKELRREWHVFLLDYGTVRKYRSRAVLDMILGWHDVTGTAHCCCALGANCPPNGHALYTYLRSPQMTADRHFCVTSVRWLLVGYEQFCCAVIEREFSKLQKET